ncbi:TPA: hypothetical protein NV714_002245 [Escherichia coli]|nr:hypothetical protein [Escherichia coli]
MNFDMRMNQNHSSFFDKETKEFLFVDTFDNFNYEVFMGTLSKSKLIGKFTATTEKDLNDNINKLYLENRI